MATAVVTAAALVAAVMMAAAMVMAVVALTAVLTAVISLNPPVPSLRTAGCGAALVADAQCGWLGGGRLGRAVWLWILKTDLEHVRNE